MFAPRPPPHPDFPTAVPAVPADPPSHPALPPPVTAAREQDARDLLASLGSLRRVIVAFSGGVDSSVVAAAARRAPLEFAIAVTAESPSVPRWQIETAKRVADEIGIDHKIIKTAEVERPDYRQNTNRRCFFCKQTLYGALAAQAVDSGDATIVSGTNADDLGDYRPGIEAGRQAGVVAPLADLGITKSRVRALADHFGLSNADLPASPCLASRVAYGVEVTPERLQRIEQAEEWLRRRGFSELRVRHHAGELARIEIAKSQIQQLIELDSDGALSRQFERFGFQYVTIDLQGFRSGSMNRSLVPLGIKLASEPDPSPAAKEVAR